MDTDSTELFVGRESVIQQVEDWSGTPEKILLISGLPGTGKSALVRQLMRIRDNADSQNAKLKQGKTTNDRPHARILAVHICQAGRDASRDPTWFVELISAQLAEGLADFASARDRVLSDLSATPITIVGSATATRVSGLNVGALVTLPGLSPLEIADRLLRRPLQHISEAQSGPIVIVDALDESLGMQASTTISRVIQSLLPDVSLRWIVTTRPDNRVRDLLGASASKIDLDDCPSGADDIQTYVSHRLRRVTDDRVTALVGRLVELADGNFLYARYVVDSLLKDRDLLGRALAVPTMPSLPADLNEIYRQFLDRELRDPAGPSAEDDWRKTYRPLLTTLAAAFEPGLTVVQLAEILPGHPGTTIAKDALSSCRQFLDGPDEQGCFRIYHQSFRDYLVKGPERVAELSEVHLELADRLITECAGHWDEADDYSVAHTAAHHVASLVESSLAPVRQRHTRSQLFDLVTDFQYCRSKVDRLGVDSLLRDLALAEPFLTNNEERVEVVEDALRRGSSTLARDPGQLASQMVGRLKHARDRSAQKLVEKAEIFRAVPWLEPLNGSLHPPHGLLRTLGRHPGVIFLHACRDGQVSVSASRNGTIKVWNLEAPGEVRAFDIGGPILEAAVTDDAQYAVVATPAGFDEGADVVIRLYNLDDGGSREIERSPNRSHRLIVRSGLVYGLTLERGADDVVVTTLRQWDPFSGSPVASQQFPFGFSHLDISPAQEAVGASYSGMIMGWGTQFEMKPFLAPHGIWRLLIVSGGLEAITASMPRVGFDELGYQDLRAMFRDERVREFVEQMDFFQNRDTQSSLDDAPFHLTIWDLEKGTAVRELAQHVGRIDALDISADGQTIVTGSSDGTVRAWERLSGALLETFAGHEGSVSEVSITPNGERVISAGGDGILKLWELPDVMTKKELSSSSDQRGLQHSAAVTCAVSASRSPRAVTAGADGTVMVWNYADGALEVVSELSQSPITALSLGAHDEVCVYGTGDGIVGTMDLRNGSFSRFSTPHSEIVTGVAFLSSMTAVSCSRDGSLIKWDLRSGQILRSFQSGGSGAPYGREFSPFLAVSEVSDVRSVVALSYEFVPDFGKGKRALSVWDMEGSEGERVVDRVFGDRPAAQDFVVLPLSSRIIGAVGYGHQLTLWDLQSGAEISSVAVGDYPVKLLVRAPDETFVAAVSMDGSVHVWGMDPTDEPVAVGRHDSEITTISVSPDAKFLLTGDQSGSGRVWSVQTKELVAEFTADAGLTESCTGRDRSFVLGDSTGAVHLLRLRLEGN